MILLLLAASFVFASSIRIYRVVDPYHQSQAIMTQLFCAGKEPSSQQRQPLTGTNANVFWRAVDADHLRQHPLFEALPEPHEVKVSTAKDFCLFRQCSWQWDALHTGRLTTSRAAACLGFYENESAKILGIPKSLSGHSKGVHARQFLCDTTTPNDWSFLNADYQKKPVQQQGQPHQRRPPCIWHANNTSASSSGKLPVPYFYRPPPTNSLPSRRRGFTSVSSARMAWGSAQESTALLTALNYFHNFHRGSIVSEVGMCALEALPFPIMPSFQSETIQAWLEDGTLPPIGASPDGIITHADGTLEALEVKCHSPFVERKGLAIFDRGPATTVASWHIPQLLLHILCAGPSCSGAVLVSLSATKGANLFRVKRDDDMIFRILTWIRLFYVTYVLEGTALSHPPINFFQNEKGYATFLKDIKAMADSCPIIAHVENKDVQRSSQNGQFFHG
mmetsp:Transcript_27534/g.39417  ORF Transcript_27534/g.39417 Transcript_27534/m.39417 type:complete len:449 (+) Transcript_27534:39-1385(+)